MKLRECMMAAAREMARVADDPALEAELLMASSLRITREQLLARLNDDAPPGFDERIRALLEKRVSGKPLSLLRGEKRFMGLLVSVEEGVFIPRYDSERLVEHVLERRREGSRLLELCCGTGAIGLAISKLGAFKEAHFADISPAAIALTRKNAQRIGVENARFHQGDLFEALAGDSVSARFDVIVSNPPYIPEERFDGLPAAVRDFEPRDALVCGDGGLAVIKRLVKEAPAHLVSGGLLALEIGEQPFEAVWALFEHAGFRDIQTAEDSVTGNRFISGVAG